MARGDLLETYNAKRRFGETPEPPGKPGRGRRGQGKGHLYSIQKHDATRLHYDLRLELDGVLKSWAITRGPSLDPRDKRLAVRTEDHPLDYATFEGTIPEGNYGAGTVLLWDRGEWEPLGDPHEGLEKGKLAFELRGERLKGRWALVRFRGKEKSKRENWLFIKEKDDQVAARDVDDLPGTSVATGRDLPAIAAARPARPKRRGRAAALPAFIAPALATLVDAVPTRGDWFYEMKFDGYRALVAASGDRVRLYTRNGHDWSDRFPALVDSLRGLDLDGALLDGEVVVVDGEGRSDFGALQRAIKGGGDAPVYCVFDLLALGGKDLRRLSLAERKRQLEQLLGSARGQVVYSAHRSDRGEVLLADLCRRGFEGIIAKQAAAPYRSGRKGDWLKIKCDRGQEFVIVGWSPSDRDRPFASLLLALRDGKGLRYAGRVGSGFGEVELSDLAGRLRKLARKTSPLTEGEIPPEIRRAARWVSPALVAEITFAAFTADGLVRHARFVGLREDKPVSEVTREEPKRTRAAKAAAGEQVAGVALTHPDRVLFAEQGLTKRDLALYLEKVAHRMLPYVAGRLVSLVRCPDGRAKKCFFQRHGGAGLEQGFGRLAVRNKDGGHSDYLYIEGLPGLITAAQMGILELHIWGSRSDDIERPDRLVFDLDPDPAVDFATVKQAARDLRDALDALGLRSFPLLTGGKGIHVVAPIEPHHDWTVIKAFARALAERFAQQDPQRFLARMSKAERKGRIFIDYLRNERGSTAIAPYSPRAREGAPLAWPVGWSDLGRIRSASAVTLASADRWLAKPDAWADYAGVRQDLSDPALRALGVEPPGGVKGKA